MIANPSVPAFRYDPYSKKLTRERYDHHEMQTVRDQAVQTARRSISTFNSATSISERDSDSTPLWGVILGTLGRQGNFKQLQVLFYTRRIPLDTSFIRQAITNQLRASEVPIPYIQILLSELSPAKLALFNPHISTFIQTSCPRLSIDWGYAFDRPLLSPYETAVAVGKAVGWLSEPDQPERRGGTGIYPMDFYEAGSPWAVSRLKPSF